MATYAQMRALAKDITDVTGERVKTVGISQPDLAANLREELKKVTMDQLTAESQVTANDLLNGVPEAPADVAPKEITVDDLKAVASDLNEVLGLDPKLDIESDTLQASIASVCDPTAQLVRLDDPLKPETWAILRHLGVGPKLEEKPKTPKTNARKAADAKKPVKEAKIIKTAYGRCDSSMDALRENPATVGDLLKRSNDLYCQFHPGKDNIKEATFAFGYVKQVLLSAGFISLNGVGMEAKITILVALPARPSFLPDLNGAAPEATPAPAEAAPEAAA